MMFGLDQLGIAKYGNLAALEHPMGWALGAFSNTFGDALPAVEKVIKTGRCPRVRLHLGWDDLHRDIPVTTLEKEAKRVAKLVQRYPLIEWRISGQCEHTSNKARIQAVRAKVLKVMPSYVSYVNSPLVSHGGALLSDCINEVHGSGARAPAGRFDFSFDGSNCVDSDVTAIKARLKRAETFYFWNCQANGRLKEDDTTPRPKRKAFPTSHEIESWVYLANERGAVQLPKGWLIKSHSDRHQTPPEPRAGKPVCIVPIKASALEFIASNGQLIAKAPYYGPYSGGGHRYYVPEFGYLLSEKAIRVSGSPVVKVRANGKLYGTVNLAFRQGSFR